MQITNTIEVVCANCGSYLPVVLGTKIVAVRGVYIIEAMPCPKCAEKAKAEKDK